MPRAAFRLPTLAVLLLGSLAACGQNSSTLGSGITTATRDAGVMDAAAREVFSLALPTVDAHPDGCVPLGCDFEGTHYCDRIGDGCGGTVDCGGCPDSYVCGASRKNVCGGGPGCTGSFTCNFSTGNYCGTISDGCGRTLDCPTTCPKSGWVCDHNICSGPPEICKARTCDVGTGARYCGIIGDDCGHALDCSDHCASLGTGWQCDASKKTCVGGPDCKKSGCAGSAGGVYCGVIGDGCGGALDCGTTCPIAGWTCDQQKGLCVGNSTCVKTTCDQSGGGHYCGTVGDGCGGSIACPDVCPDGSVCTNHVCAPAVCNAMCQAQQRCEGGVTSLRGRVYNPAGKVPVYNVVVYVPDQPLSDIAKGATCDVCTAAISGHPVTAALTDAGGWFELNNFPTGVDVPLVMQVGKWRRQVTINAAEITACTGSTIDDPQRLRLPRKQSEGNLPRIAVATGGSDALECLVRKIGVDDSEFTLDGKGGAVNLYAGYKAATTMKPGGTSVSLPGAGTLWGSLDRMKSYDMVLMSCEGSASVAASRTAAQLANVRGYADAGGHLFGSHYHNSWIRDDAVPPAYPQVVKFSSAPHSFSSDITAQVDTSFPKGAALADWLSKTGASATPGTLVIKGGEHTVDAVVPGLAQQWIFATDQDQGKPMVQYLSFNTPIQGSACGRMVFSDLHVSAASGDSSQVPFPTGCKSGDLSPQEKALEFMLFDLSACVQADTSLPVPPPAAPAAPPAPPPPAVPPPPAAPPAAPPPPAPVIL